MARGNKMKTKQAAAKRFKLTGTGRVKRSSSKRRHILSSKRRKTKRHLRQDKMLASVDEHAMRRMLPN
ncbi:MAG: 50S ribosomal protein L35 [Deltaproteobacteria bacterium]|nr:50S ribosomal protein L35 [Deltaproteobacteria bacterium]